MEGANNTPQSTNPANMPQNPVSQKLVNPINKVKNSVDPKMFMIGAFVVLAGIGTGWLLAGKPDRYVLGNGTVSSTPEVKKTEDGIGIADEETFRDNAEGVMESGGIDGEGTHHLVRDGGEDQYVYLTSTVIDLESFVGKKVHVWGETISARKAGWLMDVGKVKELE